MSYSIASPRTRLEVKQELTSAFDYRFWILIVFHIPLGYFAERSSGLATLHALFVFMLGCIFLVRDPKPNRVMQVAAYVIGAEVFWRMSGAHIFHEFAKYALIAFFLAAILKWRIRLQAGPIFYLALMLVSIPVTFETYSPGDVREYISAVLSGPLALVVAVIFFSRKSLSTSDLQGFFRASMMPIISISVFIATNLVRLEFIAFRNASNFGASGGFGPNQVSAILGLGCLLCWLIILTAKVSPLERFLFLGLSLFWLGQTLMTFSRGGLLNILIAAIFAFPLLSADKGRMGRVIIFGLLFTASVGWLIFPWLNSFTGGMLETRLQDWNVSSRDRIMQADLIVWQENVIFGVGPGASNIRRAPYFGGRLSAAHTEYSRMLAEHGLFGLASMVIMFGMAIHQILSTKDRMAKGLVIAFLLWAFVEMAHSAMRISATSFLYGLAFGVLNGVNTNSEHSTPTPQE